MSTELGDGGAFGRVRLEGGFQKVDGGRGKGRGEGRIQEEFSFFDFHTKTELVGVLERRMSEQ